MRLLSRGKFNWNLYYRARVILRHGISKPSRNNRGVSVGHALVTLGIAVWLEKFKTSLESSVVLTGENLYHLERQKGRRKRERLVCNSPTTVHWTLPRLFREALTYLEVEKGDASHRGIYEGVKWPHFAAGATDIVYCFLLADVRYARSTIFINGNFCVGCRDAFCHRGEPPEPQPAIN